MGLGFNDGFVPLRPKAVCENTPEADYMMSSKVSSIQATRKELTEVFGEPMMLPDPDKVTTQWVLTFTLADGEKMLATIYDYKHGWEPTANEFIEWSIGGYTSEAGMMVKEFMELN